MYKLKEEHIHMIENYQWLLETIEEGFEYIEGHYGTNTSNIVLADIFLALEKINVTNVLLQSILEENIVVIRELNRFEAVLHEIRKLELNFDEENLKKKVLLSNVIPAFNGWKISIENVLKHYIQH